MLKNTAIRELFATTDSVLVCDIDGKIMFYEGFDDEIMLFKNRDLTSMTIFEMYPFIEPDHFTVIKAMRQKKPIVNELQYFIFNGVKKRSLNTAYPLRIGDDIVGGIVLSLDLDKATYPTKHNFEDIITEDPVFTKRLEALKIFSKNNSSILIYGETGTGKELIAHTIHANSTRYGKPFIVQNCAAIPSNLMESIFFGTTRGSFTGAVDKIGLFEEAKGGTLFLDEINSLPFDLQGKILRAIENRSITRIGEAREREIDVRILASTNEDLAAKVSRKEFRADLFYRLNVVRFDIPPLRNRVCDIKLLCGHYLHYYNALLTRDVSGIDSPAMCALCAYSWPGNVRELKNMFEAILNIKQDGFITLEDLPDYILANAPTNDEILEEELSESKLPFGVSNVTRAWNPKETLASQLEATEVQIIREAFTECRYNISKTASALNISRQTLYNKLYKYRLL